MLIHKNCGGEIDTYLMYSDADQDYYATSCTKCGSAVKPKDVIAEPHKVSADSYEEYRTVQMLQGKVAVLEELAIALLKLASTCRSGGHPKTSCPRCMRVKAAIDAVKTFYT